MGMMRRLLGHSDRLAPIYDKILFIEFDQTQACGQTK
jgi:hypothetical protein